MANTKLLPITGIYFQTAKGNYYAPWDAALRVMILDGTGIGTATIGGKACDLVSASPAATDPRLALTNPSGTPVPGWTEKQLDGAHDHLQPWADVAGPNATLIIAGPARQTVRLKFDTSMIYPDEPVTLG